MERMGVLEARARADLETLVHHISRDYAEGTLATLSATDPAWRAALDRAEGEVGALYVALREADATWAEWRRAVGELHRLWAPARRVAGEGDGAALDELDDVA